MQKSIIIAGLVFASCTPSNLNDDLSEDSDNCDAFLSQIESQSPAKEAEANWKRGSRELVGINSYSLSFPGLDDMETVEREGYLNLNGYKVIEGTSDVITSDGCLQFQLKAYAYAKQYNLEVIKLSVRASEIEH